MRSIASNAKSCIAVEKLCAHYTDVLITINKEDYSLAKRKMMAQTVEFVPGVGVDLDKFCNDVIDRSVKRIELGIPENAKVLLSVGELNENKNHECVIRAIEGMDVYYIIAGKGGLHDQLLEVAEEVGVSDRVKLLGYRKDVAELYKASDVFVFPSFREGLSASLMEAMASGLPVVCSRIRGNTDLINENGGALFNPHSVIECKNALSNVCFDNTTDYGAYNTKKVVEFSFEKVSKEMHRIYFNE